MGLGKKEKDQMFISIYQAHVDEVYSFVYLRTGFGGILIWKIILYIIYLKDFAGLKGWRFFCAFVVLGLYILVMATLDGYLGVITPVL